MVFGHPTNSNLSDAEGHIHGKILRINQLCSGKDDVTNIIQTFFCWLMARGHKPPTLLPIFDLALDNAQKFIAMSDGARKEARTTKYEESKQRVYFHK